MKAKILLHLFLVVITGGLWLLLLIVSGLQSIFRKNWEKQIENGLREGVA